MLPATSGSPLRALTRLLTTRLGACLAALFVALVIGCSTNIQVVQIGLPVMSPFFATAGQRVRVQVQLIDKAGCNTAAISATYNGAVISTKQVATGGVYSDSLTAVLGQNLVQAAGTCGDAIQTRTDSFVVNP